MTIIAASDISTSTRRTTAARQPHSFAGLGNLLRFTARRDRVRGPGWVAGIAVMLMVSAAAIGNLYTTPEDLASYAAVVNADAAIKAITGPGYGLDNPTDGAVVMNEMSMFTLIGVALMCIFMVVRHTRAEEETDRAELVRAAPVGRHTALAASMIWVGGVAIATGAATAVGLMFWLPVEGSLAFGAALAGMGLVSVGVGAVTSQLAATARSAKSIAGAALGVSFLVRAAGDVSGNWLTWVSPLGWAQGIRAYADERWWVLLPLLGAAAVLMGSSIALSARRDLGHGLLTQRLGPAEGAPRLATPLALAARLQRGSVIGWTFGISLMGFFMGIVANQAEELAQNDAIAEMMAQAGGGSITESFLASMMAMMALIASGFFVSSVLRLRSEERAIRASPILATPVSRRKWLWSHLTVALVGGAILMVAAGFMTGVGYAIQVGDFEQLLPLIGAGLALLSAQFVLAGVAVLLVGATPRAAPFAWAVVGFVFVVGLLGDSLDLPQWVRNLSPFEHVPQMPAADFEPLPVVLLVAVAAVLIALGTLAMRRRDVT